MILVRPEQLEDVARASIDEFVAGLAGEVGPRPTTAHTRQLVSATIAAAMRCGFTSKAGIREFVLRVRTLGPAYHEHASVRDWLREPGLTEDEKLAAVDTHADAIRASAATTPGAGG